MSSVFISYSRIDKVCVRRLVSSLEADGREVWVDWEDIPPTAEWLREIYDGIEKADSFVFVLSPDSIHSPYCAQELAHALKNNKRLIPVVCREFSSQDAPRQLADINWIFFRPEDDFDQSLPVLLHSMDLDLDSLHIHTRLQVRAIEWQNKNRSGSLLLRGEDLKGAEAWLKTALGKEPDPTQIQSDYIHQSRLAEVRRGRITWSAIVIAIVIAILLSTLAINSSIYGEQQRVLKETEQSNLKEQLVLNEIKQSNLSTQESITSTETAGKIIQQTLATSRRLASQAYGENDHSAALLLAVESYEQFPTNEASGALLTLVQQKPQLALQLQSNYQRILNQVFSQDGLKLAVLGCNDFKLSRGCIGPEIFVYDAQTGRALGSPAITLPRNDGMFYLAFPKGNLLAYWIAQDVVLFQSETGKVLDKIQSTQIQGKIERLSLNPNKDAFLIDHPEGIALQWQTSSLDDSFLLAPGGQYAADPTGQGLYDLTTRSLLGQPLKTKAASYLGMVFNGQNLQGLIEQNGSKSLWDITTGKAASAQVVSEGLLASLSLNPQSAAILDAKGEISIWSPSSAVLKTIPVSKEWKPGDGSLITNLALSPEGAYLAVGYSGLHPSLPFEIPYGVMVLEIGSGKLIGEYLKAPEKPSMSQAKFSDLKFTSSGLLAAAYTDGSIVILDPKTGAFQASGNIKTSSVLSISPNGSWLAAGHPNGVISLVDTATIASISELKGYDSPVVSLAFTPDSQQLISSHADGSLVVWDLRFDTLKERACRQANRNFTQDEWRKYMPAVPYRNTCPAQPFRLSTIPGPSLEYNLPERLIQPLPESVLPEPLQNILHLLPEKG